MYEKPVIVCQDLTCKFGEETIFDGLSLDIPENSFFSIIGKSGMGKSTFLRLLSGVIKPDRGTISIFGHSPKVARKQKAISVCPQEAALMPWLSVRKNVELAFKMWGLEVNPKQVEWALETVGLFKHGDKYPAQLSGGMKSRTALARAWASDAPVLLLDESFSSLDEITREELCQDLTKLWQEQRRTVIYVTHVISEAILLSTHLWPLSLRERAGRINPIVIGNGLKKAQLGRDRSVLHLMLLSELDDDWKINNHSNDETLERFRNALTEEEKPILLSMLADPKISSRARDLLTSIIGP